MKKVIGTCNKMGALYGDYSVSEMNDNGNWYALSGRWNTSSAM